MPCGTSTRPDYPWTLVAARDFSGVLASDTTTAIPCWTRREDCLIAINIALLSPAGVALRRHYEVSLESCLAVARTDAATADTATGRNVQTAHRTGARRMAAALGVIKSPRTYRKARDIMRLLGFQVVTDEGRYLTKTERLEAELKRDPNSRRPAQRRKASTRVFTMARKIVGHLPRRGSTRCKPDLNSTHQKRAKARSAAPQPLTMELPLQRLAANLVNTATFLRSVNPRTIGRALERAGICPEWWTAHDVATAMYAGVTERRWSAPAQLENAAGYFRFLLGTIQPEQIRAHVARKRKALALRETRLATARAATPPAPRPQQQAVNARGAARVREVLRAGRIVGGTQ